MPLRVIRLTIVDPVDALGGARRALGGRHRERQEEVVVAGDEARHAFGAEGGEAPGQELDQQRPGRLRAHVQLVAHLEALGREAEDVDRPFGLEETRQRRTRLVAEEDEALHRLVVADAEPERVSRGPR